MQQYTFWMYQYINSFVSWYSEYSWFLQWTEPFFQNYHVLYLPNSYRTVKLAYNAAAVITQYTQYAVLKSKHQYITHDIRYIQIFNISIQLNLYQYCITGLMYHDMMIHRYIVTSLLYRLKVMSQCCNDLSYIFIYTYFQC